MKGLSRQFQILFFIIIVIAAGIMLVTLAQFNWTSSKIMDLILFGFLAIGSESLPVALPQGGYVTVSYAIFFASLILFPPAISLAVVALSGLLVVSRPGFEQPFYKRLFNGAQYVVSIKAANLVLLLLHLNAFQFNFESVVVYCLVAITFVIANLTIVAAALGALLHKSPWAIWISNIRWSIPNFLALVPLGLLMSLIYKNYGSVGLILLSIPLLLSRHSFQRYMDIRENYLATVEALVKAIEAKDPYTRGHSDRVARYAVAIAEKIKLAENKIDCIKYIGILHDLGKIGVSENILNKTSKLGENEWDAIRNHPVTGEDIVKNIKFLYEIGPGVRHHHERYDGTGYPDGLKGNDIPLEARIIAVADSYDAMTSDRSYRGGRTPQEAVEELIRGKGNQFDPQIVDVFCEVLPEIINQVTPSPSMPVASPQQDCVS